MNPALNIWLRSVWIYALLTLPALAFPLIYVLSLGLSLAGAVPALPLFAACLSLLRRLRPGSKSLALFLALSAALFLAFGCSFLICFWLFRSNAWNGFGNFYLFPLAAVAAAAVAVFSYHRRLFKYLNPQHYANSFPEMA